MIKTVKELQTYILKDAAEFEEHMMTSPGCSKKEIEEFKRALPAISDSYTKWVKAINLNGIAVGYFQLSPLSYNPVGMVANLIAGNEEGVLFSEYARHYHLYSVATIDGYGIFVATSSCPYEEGEILAIAEDIYADQENPSKWIYKLAKDFEQFLIVSGNINQLHREIIKDDSKYNEKKKEFLERLKILGVEEKYHEAWLRFF